MARTSLGSAEYELLINNEALLRGFAQAEAQARVNAKKIADAVDTEMRRIEGRQSKAAEAAAVAAKRGADAQIREAQRAGREKERLLAQEERRAQEAARKVEATRRTGGGGPGVGQLAGGLASGAGLPSFLGSIGGGPGAAAIGVVTGLGAALAGSVKATLDAEQAQRQLNAVYKESAGTFTQLSRELSAATGFTQAALTESAALASTLTRNYGLTNSQLQEVIKRSADLAAVTGHDLVPTTKAVSDAIRGEAEAAESLGLTLGSDLVKATAEMTDEQRKNWETLDEATKAQIRYNEFLKQSGFAQGEAAKNLDTLAGQMGAAATAAKELGEVFGKLSEGPLIAALKVISGELKGLTEFIKGTNKEALALLDLWEQIRRTFQPGAEEVQGPLPSQVFAQQKAAAEAAASAEKAATTARDQAKTARERDAKDELNREKSFAESNLRIELEINRLRVEGAQEAAAKRRQEIEDTRDRDIKASQQAAEAAIRNLDERQEAEKAYYDAAIKAVERQRDADIQFVEDRRDAAIKAIEEEQRAVENARRLEDRTIEDSREAEQREENERHESAMIHFEMEQQAVERQRDVALRAIDDRMDAEDRRHRELMRNLDEEEFRQMQFLDQELRAIAEQEQKEQRSETDRSLKRGVSEAKRDVREADTPEERRRARQRLADAEREIEKEQRRRQREDRRAQIQEEKNVLRESIRQEKEYQTDRFNESKQAAEAEKQLIQDSTKDKLAELELMRKGEQSLHETSVQALQDRYKEEDRLREDRRRLEDEAFAARIEKIQTQAEAELQVIRTNAAAAVEALRAQATERDRYYADQKRAVQENARAEQESIRATAEAQLRTLTLTTNETIRHLNRQAQEWENLGKRIQAALANAQRDIGGFLSGSIRVEYWPAGSAPDDRPRGSTRGIDPRWGPGYSTGPADEERMPEPAPRQPERGLPPEPSESQYRVFYKGRYIDLQEDLFANYLHRFGYQPGTPDYEIARARIVSRGGQHGDWFEDFMRYQGYARGGWIKEPTLLTSMRTGQPYAIAGEGGRPEWVGPVSGGGSAAGMNAVITINDNRTDVAAGPDWAGAAPRIAEYFAGLLTHAQDAMPGPADSMLPGAEGNW